MIMKKHLCLLSVLMLTTALMATDFNVTNADEFNNAAKQVVAGDQIILSSGVWKDAQLILKRAFGTADQPIRVTVAEKGKTSLEGRSQLRFSGEYIVIEGLVFQNPADSLDKTVIEFRTSSSDYAHHCVVRECAVDHFNPADKTFQTTWLSLWGKNNEVAYCYFAGKNNQGTTFIVWPNDSSSIENHHRIHHNYFGSRLPLGSNGGETMRIGTSHVCKNNSQTIVEDNYFEHCSGEVEIISIKSCENIIRRNTFYECEGSLVLRHGDRNEAYDNVFIGNNKKHTGGIRIVNANHHVFNNLFYSLAGDDFCASLCIMNGIPNSAPNGYERVKDVLVERNTWVGCQSPIELCNGKGTRDRDEKPLNTVLTKNLIYCPSVNALVKEYDHGHDVRIVDNILVSANTSEGEPNASFFWNGLYIPTAEGFGFMPSPDHVLASATTCGPQWYSPQPEHAKPQRSPKTWQVEAGRDILPGIVKKAIDGDILMLADGEHQLTKTLRLHKSLILQAAQGAHPTITIESDANTVKMMELGAAARIEMKGIHMRGDTHEANPAKYCFAVNKENATHYQLFLEDCEISGFVVSSGAVLKAAVNTFADTIWVRNCNIHDCFRGFALAEEKEEKGKYNAESVIFDHSRFERITQWVLDYNRLGIDESTTGGSLQIDHCVFNEVNDREDQVSLRQKGIKTVSITNTVFMNSLCKNSFRLDGPNQKADNCCIYLSGPAKATRGAMLTNIYDKNPKKLKGIGL